MSKKVGPDVANLISGFLFDLSFLGMVNELAEIDRTNSVRRKSKAKTIIKLTGEICVGKIIERYTNGTYGYIYEI